MVTPETISARINNRRFPKPLFLILLFFITLTAIVANTLLRNGIEEIEHSVDLLLRIQGFANHLSALEWQAIGEGQMTSEIDEAVHNVQAEMEQAMGDLEQINSNSELLISVQQSYLVYASNISEEFRLITEGNFVQARLVDEERVDPSFNVLTQALTSANATYSDKANQAEQLGIIGTALLAAFAFAAIALLFWRFQDAQVATVIVNSEKRALVWHQDDLRLLNEMGNKLRTCTTVAAAYDVIANFIQRLFPSVSGALYVINKVPGIFETVVSWGESPPRLPGHALSADMCWALHQEQVYDSEDSTSHGGLCPYLGQPSPDGYLCVPMLAQGETLGVLHLRRSKSPQISKIQSEKGMDALKRPLAETVAEHIALALTNLRLQEVLQYQAIRDPLTGLFNRRYMEETFKRELDRAVRHKTTIGVIMLDIDQFKLFNDTYGHSAGDEVLVKVSALLMANIRGEDIACRYGGEELLLILLEAQLRDTERWAEQLRSEIQHLSVQYQGQSLGVVTVSLGISGFPEHGETIESLLAAADTALYLAKTGGRNRLVVAQAGGE